jgi:hypothetical protein
MRRRLFHIMRRENETFVADRKAHPQEPFARPAFEIIDKSA